MIVREEKYQHLLSNQGFFVTPLLSAKDVKVLCKLHQLAPVQLGGFTATAHLEESEKRTELSDEIKKIIEPRISNLLNNINVLGASFVVKSAGFQEVLQPHQDWNIIDETEFRSYNIWIPLVDTSRENGAILVMPGSHKWIESIRHSSIPCAFQEVHNELFDLMHTLEIPAGHALVYDHALLHASHANQSSHHRVAIAVGIKPKNALMRIHWNNNGEIKVYEVNERYFMEENIFNQPQNLICSEVIQYDFPKVTLSQLSQFTGVAIEKKNNSKKMPWYRIYTPFNIAREVAFRIKSI